ncbi:MAG TPA: hypothetical protein VNV86_14550 [Candidatus Acidoferrum sp.]|nr:hypothetical protein [Candidatus Acidoferrum sp.]
MILERIDFSVPTDLKADLSSLRTKALAVGAIGTLATVAGYFVAGPTEFFRSWLWAYIYIIALTVGPLAWVMLYYSTGGAWGVVIRRTGEAASRTIWLTIVMFLPILFGASQLYPWTNAEYVKAHEVVAHKEAYLNITAWAIRAFIYLFGWALLTLYYNKWSIREDAGDPKARGKLTILSGPGLIFHALAVTFLSVDWVMSQDPTWFSTMWGLLFIASGMLTAMAFLITVMVMLQRYSPMREVLTQRHLHDMGKFTLALVMVWAYFSFSQFLIIWAGNLPEEIPFFLRRMNHGWGWVGLALVFGHFALPFALLLSRDLKRNFKLLRNIALFILCMRFVDLFWLTKPFAYENFHFTWMDITAPVGMVGLWLAYFFTNLQQRPLLPVNDPNLEEALAHGREH